MEPPSPGSPIGRDTCTRTFFHTQAPGIWAFFQVSQWGPHGKRCPSPEPSSVPPGSPNRAPIKREAPFPEPSFFHYLSQFPVNGPPPQVPPWDPYGERHLSIEPSTPPPLKIRLSLRVTIKGSPSMFPNCVPMERDTPSPEPLVYLFIYVCQSPQKWSPTKWGKIYGLHLWSLAQTEGLHTMGAAWFPKEIVNDAVISIPLPCGPWNDTFHHGLGRQEPFSQYVS